jgi:hypothetical protein
MQRFSMNRLLAWLNGLVESIRVRGELVALEREARDARRRATYRALLTDAHFARAVHDNLARNPGAQGAWLDAVAAARATRSPSARARDDLRN